MKPYLYFKGLKKLAKEATGKEVVHIGIRPYGFHAGNVMSMIVYPYLLCKELQKEGKVPKFKFFVSINDWEQDSLDGPDYRRYPFNIFPKKTIIKFVTDDKKCCKSIMHHWRPIIERNILVLKKTYPRLTFKFVKNSDLISNSICKKLLKETITSPREQLKIYKKFSGKEILDTTFSFAKAVCPACNSACGQTIVQKNNKVNLMCESCGTNSIKPLNKFQYWWYHKPMLLARILIFKTDILISGGDHFSEGDFKIREALLKKYSPKFKIPKMLFSPIVLSTNGERMSKSKYNTQFANISKLIKATEGFDGDKFQLTPELIIDTTNEKNYSCIF